MHMFVTYNAGWMFLAQHPADQTLELHWFDASMGSTFNPGGIAMTAAQAAQQPGLGVVGHLCAGCCMLWTSVISTCTFFLSSSLQILPSIVTGFVVFILGLLHALCVRWARNS